ncbi:MAG: hypothetical protein ACKOE2_06575, partial [Actinomycetales bacterium]
MLLLGARSMHGRKVGDETRGDVLDDRNVAVGDVPHAPAHRHRLAADESASRVTGPGAEGQPVRIQLAEHALHAAAEVEVHPGDVDVTDAGIGFGVDAVQSFLPRSRP